MQKKHQIFISSTFTDLKVERQAAVEATLTAGHIPAGMELFAAGDESQMEVIKRWIDESDIYMLILGGRYGSIDDSSKLSYTEIEYDYALQKGKPYFALVLTDKAIDSKSTELANNNREKDNTDKYNSFRSKVLSKISKNVDDYKDIKIGILESIRHLESKYSLHGWVRSNQLPNVSPLLDQLDKLSTENSDLKSRLKNTPVSYIDEDISLAGMEDSISITVSYRDNYKGSKSPIEIDLTWTEIFGLVGPKLLSGQGDDYIKSYMGGQILKSKNRSYYDQTINEQDFQTIKIQLIALNLITTIYANATDGNAALFWKLTELGEKTLLKIRTVKKTAESKNQ